MAKLKIKDLENMTTFQADILGDIGWQAWSECHKYAYTEKEEKKIDNKYRKIASKQLKKWGYSKKAIKEYFENAW